MLETEEEITQKWAKEYFEGKKLLLLSGIPKQNQKESIKNMLGLYSIDWPSTSSGSNNSRLESLVNQADVVVLNISLASHSFISSIEKLVANSKAKFITVTSYSSTKIIEESFKKIASQGTLAARTARASQRKSSAMLSKLQNNPELKQVYVANAKALRPENRKEIPIVPRVTEEKKPVEPESSLYMNSKKICQEIAQNLREVQRNLEFSEQSKLVILEQVEKEFEAKLIVIQQERERSSNLEESYYNQHKESIDKVSKLKLTLEYAELLVVSQE